MNVLDVLLHEDLRQDFIRECENLLLSMVSTMKP